MQKIAVDKITIPEIRASSYLTDEQKAFLEASIKQFGIFSPIIVRKIDFDKYELIAGKNRLEEAKKAGIHEIDAIVVDVDIKSAIMMHLMENLARGSTNPVDEAAVLQHFIDNGGTIEEAAKLTGHTVDWVKFRLAINKLPDQFKEHLKNGILKLGHIELASQLPSSEEMAHALNLAAFHEWTVPVMEKYIQARLMEYELEKSKGELKTPLPLPTSQQVEQMIKTFQCFGCMRVLDVKLERNPTICEECYTLLRYLTSQLGDPKECMEKVYTAWQHYERYQEFLRQKEIFEKFEKEKKES